jgi:hypothetical protein
MFGDYDPVRPLSDSVFSALELLMADCGLPLSSSPNIFILFHSLISLFNFISYLLVLATEPSMNPILVTNNLFFINCGALARGVVFKQFDVQIVSEETAEHIQVYSY